MALGMTGDGAGSLSSRAHHWPGAGLALTSELPSDPPDRKVFRCFLNHLLKSSSEWSLVQCRIQKQDVPGLNEVPETTYREGEQHLSPFSVPLY